MDELKQAVEIVKEFNKNNRYRDGGKINNAIDTVLQAVDNSISKNKVRNLIENSGLGFINIKELADLLNEGD